MESAEYDLWMTRIVIQHKSAGLFNSVLPLQFSRGPANEWTHHVAVPPHRFRFWNNEFVIRGVPLLEKSQMSS